MASAQASHSATLLGKAPILRHGRSLAELELSLYGKNDHHWAIISTWGVPFDGTFFDEPGLCLLGDSP